MSVPEILQHVNEHQLHEASLQYKSKEDLQHFILEVFNKGVLNNYLTIDNS
jgi:hypothetical protein